MTTQTHSSLRIAAVTCLLVALAACSKKEETATTQAPATAAPTATATPVTTATAGPPPASAWTPEALEDLLAPIAIYPDVVLGHVLNASTNPQEVLDAGNWLIAHQDLTGSARDDAASKLGFSPSVRALLQFPEALDMMCMKMDWTTQLGQAFTADQSAVLDAVQRLRKQAEDVGNLKSSPQLAVETETQEGKEVVTVKPADPKVVYVPKYDPVAVYAPPPATIPPPTTVPVVGATTTTTSPDGTVTTTTTGMPGAATTTTASTTTTSSTTSEEKGHSTGALITTGLLAFGAGILVNEVFDDDDDWDDYYPNYYHGGMYHGGGPYYPPPPYMYRPPYGPGFYPSNGYVRPPNYQHGFNNNTIIVNNGGGDYWNRYNPGSPRVYSQPARSPITAANSNRPELATLNREAADRAKLADSRARPGTQPTLDRTQGNLSGQTGYAGARPENREARERMVQNSPKPTDRDRAAKLDNAGVAADLPKRPTGTYAGANKGAGGNKTASRDTRPASKPNASASNRETPRPRPSGTADRGHAGASDRPQREPDVAQLNRPTTPEVSRPSTSERSSDAFASTRDRNPSSSGTRDRSAFDGGGRSAASERAASQRGKSSMPKGAHDARNRR
jgi:hypothetical protein